MSSITNEENERSCNGCTKCCEGWLSCHIYGHEVKPGKPCFYLKDESCSIYNTRPVSPCRNFKCAWLNEPDKVPEEFWPKASNIIMVRRVTPNGNPYMAFHEAGGKMPVEMLDWAVQCVQYGFMPSIVYTIDGKRKVLSTQKEFMDEVQLTLEIDDTSIE